MKARSLDKEKIKSKLDIIQSQRTLLDDFINLSYDEFTSDLPEFAVKYDACLYRLQIALQAVLDVGQYIASCTSETLYRENKDVFDIIRREGAITSRTAEVFKSAIGVRNILVHQYEQVDPQIIFNIIKNDLKDFDTFVVEISDYLDRQGD